jgi:hypothetical protein
LLPDGRTPITQASGTFTPGDRIFGRFEPRRADDLKPGMEQWLGWEGEWEILREDRRTTPLRQEIAEIVRPARALIKAHESRNPTSDYATLGEEEALMFLKERINALAERLARRP